MKVLSLFSGVGGFDLGLEAAGMETVFQCEWDKHATKILERHWPNVPKWGDVSTLTAAHILSVAPVVDVVAWGSPCQDLSLAGKRAGLGGERSGLFHEGIRIIREMRELTDGKYPRISVWENVAGALSSGGGADFGQVLYEMDEVGACFSEWRTLDAQYFGVPQRRRRVFVVSVFDPATAARCPDPLLPVKEGVRRDTAQGATARQGAASEVAGGIGGRNEHVAGCLTARDVKGADNIYAEENKLVVEKDEHQRIVEPVTTHMSSPRGTETSDSEHLVVEPFTGSSHAQYTEGVGTLRANGGDLAGGSKTLLTATDVHAIAFSRTQGLSAQPSEEAFPTLRREGSGMAVATPLSVRMREGKPGGGKGPLISEDKSLTLGCANDQTVLTPTMTVRRLTPLECERLMGWPDNWTAGQSDTHRYKQCGNGVASPVAEWIGRQLINL
jgi:DNA (cytosine-5)-methyltransferase 1